MAPVLPAGALIWHPRRNRRGVHQRILVRAGLVGVGATTTARLRQRGRRDGRVGHPGEFHLADGRDVAGAEHELLGLVAFLEGHDEGVGLVGVGFDGGVFADALFMM